MKLCRVGKLNEERPAIIDKNNNYRDLSSIINDFSSDTLNFEIIEKIKNTDVSKLPIIDPKIRLGPCVYKPSKFIGIGLNYKDNSENAKIFLEEMGNPYNIILLDNEGTISIEWGAYGVPETFLIYNKKVIKKIIGPIDEKILLEIKDLI